MSTFLESIVEAVKVNVLSPRSDAAHYRQAARDRAYGIRFPSIPVSSLERLGELADSASTCVVFSEPGASRWLLDRGCKVVHLDRDHGQAFGVEFRLTPEQADNLNLRVVERGHKSGHSEYRKIGLDAIEDKSLVIIGGSSRRKILSEIVRLPVRPHAIVLPDGGSRRLREACKPMIEMGWRAEVVWGLSASASSTDASVTFLTV